MPTKCKVMTIGSKLLIDSEKINLKLSRNKIEKWYKNRTFDKGANLISFVKREKF